MFQRIAAAALLVLASAIGVATQGRPFVTDQVSPPSLPPIPFTLAVGGSAEGQYLAQTVTVGAAGRLWEIRVPIGCDGGTLLLEIRDVAPDGRPGPLIRRSLTFDGDGFPPPVTSEYRPLRVSGPPLRFAAGERFSFVLYNPTTTCGVWPGPEGDSYAGGTGWFISPPNPPDAWVDLGLGTNRPDLPFETVMHTR